MHKTSAAATYSSSLTLASRQILKFEFPFESWNWSAAKSADSAWVWPCGPSPNRTQKGDAQGNAVAWVISASIGSTSQRVPLESRGKRPLNHLLAVDEDRTVVHGFGTGEGCAAHLGPDGEPRGGVAHGEGEGHLGRARHCGRPPTPRPHISTPAEKNYTTRVADERDFSNQTRSASPKLQSYCNPRFCDPPAGHAQAAPRRQPTRSKARLSLYTVSAGKNHVGTISSAIPPLTALPSILFNVHSRTNSLEKYTRICLTTTSSHPSGGNSEVNFPPQGRGGEWGGRALMAAMQMRPLSSWSATRRNLSLADLTWLWNTPPASTSENAFSSAPLGTRTRSNHSW